MERNKWYFIIVDSDGDGVVVEEGEEETAFALFKYLKLRRRDIDFDGVDDYCEGQK